MISILLAEAVLEQQGRISTVQDSRNEVTFFGKESEFLGTYNIHELAHKCKEWARSIHFNGDIIHNRIYRTQSYYSSVYNNITKRYEEKAVCDVIYGQMGDVEKCLADTEPEAIFQACQWILDNKDSK